MVPYLIFMACAHGARLSLRGRNGSSCKHYNDEDDDDDDHDHNSSNNTQHTVNDPQADNFGPSPFSVRDAAFLLAEHLHIRRNKQPIGRYC